MALTYAQLVTAIEETTENEEDTFFLNIPLFIRQGEQRIYTEASIPATDKLSNSVCSAGNQYLSVPSGFLAPLSLAVVVGGAHSFLLNKEVSYIREAYPTAATTGVPTAYAVFNDTQFILGPTPASNYAMEIRYTGFPTSIVDAGTSWLGNNFETVLLYAALINAHIFMKGEEDVLKMYEARYAEALALLKKLGAAAHKDAYR